MCKTACVLLGLACVAYPSAAFHPSVQARSPAAQKRFVQPRMDWGPAQVEKAKARNNQNVPSSGGTPEHLFAEIELTNAEGFYARSPIETLEQTNTDMGPGFGRDLYWTVAKEPREYQEKMVKDFTAMTDAFQDGGDVEYFISDASLYAEDKMEFIDEIAKELEAGEPLVKTIKQMVEDERYEWWEEALESFKAYVSIGNKDMSVHVITSSEDLMPEIEPKAKAYVPDGYTPVITYKVDPELMGGYRIIVDNANLYDFSGVTDESYLTDRINEALPLIVKVMAKIKLEEAGWLPEDFAAVGM